MLDRQYMTVSKRMACAPWPLSLSMVSMDEFSPNQPRRSAIRCRLLHSGHCMMTTPLWYDCLLKLRMARLSASKEK